MHTHKTQLSWACKHLSLERDKERNLLMWYMSGVKGLLMWHFFQKSCGKPESPHYLESADSIKNFTANTLLGFIFNSRCSRWKAIEGFLVSWKGATKWTKRKSDPAHLLNSVTKNVNIVSIGRGKVNLQCTSEPLLKVLYNRPHKP